ncbi:peptidase S14 ClpP [Anaeromyxobacter dehalogenans 2CP-1]|uniref:ATP-dependent Clp protease proteolytic subunit n=1 Tax=Anaeromyxobacter dehalogenans (strain ATCC BAA-258 / DSM 21875 / 2CP-1) TaxID=455488 RepID=B8JGH7_ANAD2|nr:head maturation protease, ClpP-related [Anaeromyxobacter dehalogenans]ACL64648.1 peptidase S14 ClpP [Anaeromyxobacter dehalogenans 2CP-1]
MKINRSDLSAAFPWMADPRVAARLSTLSRVDARVDKKAEVVDVYLYDVIVTPEIEALFGVGISAQGFREQLKQADGARRVNVHINSPGGDVDQGKAMLSGLRSLRAGEKVAVVEGLAASAATVVAMGADRVVMEPEAVFMIHEASGGMWGSAADHEKFAEILRMDNAAVRALYAKKTGLDDGRIAELMAAQEPGGTVPGTYMDAARARELGFADEVLAPPTKEAAAAFRATASVATPNQIAVKLAFARSRQQHPPADRRG